MSESDPFSLVDLLVDAGVSVVVIGGHAVNYYGYLRATEDLDVLFERTEESERALATSCWRLMRFGSATRLTQQPVLKRRSR